MLTPLSTYLYAVVLLCLMVGYSGYLTQRTRRLGPLAAADRIIADLGRRLYLPLVLAAVVLALFARLYRFPELPLGTNRDGIMAAVDARALMMYGTDRFGTPWPVHLEAWGSAQMSALLSYLLAPAIKVFGLSRLTLRLPIMLLSLGGLWAVYALGRAMAGRTYALIALALVAVAPWHIMQSRWALEANTYPHVLLLGVLTLVLGLRRKGWLVVSMILFGLSMYGYGVSLFTTPLLLVGAAIYLLATRRLSWRWVLLCGAIYLAVGGPYLACMWVNYQGLDSFSWLGFTVQSFPESIRSEDLVWFSPQFYTQLSTNFNSTMSTLLFQLDSYVYNALPEYGIAYLFTAPLLLAGIGSLCLPRTKCVPEAHGLQAPARAVVAIWLCAGVLTGLMIDSANINRINSALYPAILVAAYALYQLARRVKVLAPVLAVVYLIAFGGFCADYFGPVRSQEIGTIFDAGYVEAAQLLDQQPYGVMVVDTLFGEGYASEKIADIYIQYALGLDSAYVRGEQGAADAKGEPLPPYDQRFRFVDYFDYTVDPDEDAVYLVRDWSIPLFPKEQYHRERFGDYYAVWPLR